MTSLALRAISSTVQARSFVSPVGSQIPALTGLPAAFLAHWARFGSAPRGGSILAGAGKSGDLKSILQGADGAEDELRLRAHFGWSGLRGDK